MIILIILCLFLFLFFKFFKLPKIGNLALVTGGVKSGKTLMSVWFSYRVYKRNLFSIKFINFFRKIFKKELYELPLFYSNIPLGFDYIPIDRDILQLKKRVVWGSVMFIDEASLFADSQLIQDKEINTNLLMFNKLCAHFGLSLLMYNTQSIQDVHYSIKRSLSNYFYVHHSRKLFLLPFVIMYVQEYRYSDDGSVIAITGDKDLELSLKRVVIPKRIFKLYDSHCYKKIIEKLEYSRGIIQSNKKSDLSCDKIISFRRDFANLLNKRENVRDFNEVQKLKEFIEKEKKNEN